MSLLAASGCATVNAPSPARPAQETVHVGEIVRVNAASGYVVAECSVLPSPGEEATVTRGNQAVGRIRFTGQARTPYAVADIVAGRPLAGDRWRRAEPTGQPPLEQQP